MKDPVDELNKLTRDYPTLSKDVEIFRCEKGIGLPNWPNWCFMPMAAWTAIATNGGNMSLNEARQISRLSAIGAWRYTQSIYRLDPYLYSAIIDTDLSGKLPTDLFYRLPEWSVYIETPNYEYMDLELSGFWAHLERDANTGRDELRLLLMTNDELMPVILHLSNCTVAEAIAKATSEAINQASMAKGMRSEYFAIKEHGQEITQSIKENIGGLISLVLYVCSDGVEYSEQSKPSYPRPKKTKKGWRLFPAQKPRIWNLGRETGENIRKGGLGGGKKAPHIRRAHWHSYWTGTQGDKKIIAKWLPPTLVSAQ